MNATEKIHPFEASGLGRAPFEFIGVTTKVGPITLADGITQVGAPGQPMGTCDHCGQGIKDCFRVRSADGKSFEVGCDCIAKIYRTDNLTSSELARDSVYQQIQAARRQKARERRHERERAKIAGLVNELDLHKDEMRKLPHARKWAAEQGQTMFDEYQWWMENAGNSGKIGWMQCALRRILGT